MRRHLFAVCSVFLSASGAWSADADMPRKAAAAVDAAKAALADPCAVTVASDIRYFSWHANRGQPSRSATTAGHGQQIYTPYAVQVAGRQPGSDWKVELLARGGWVWSRQQAGALSGEVETTTDTQTSASFTYLGWPGVQPFLAV